MSDLATIGSLVSALGVGGLLGQWYGGGKDRRAARAAVLKELATVEQARWWTDTVGEDLGPLRAAVRDLESAALVARVPRKAVVPYIQLAHAAFWITAERGQEGGEPEAAYLENDEADRVRDAAEIVSRAAWSTPLTRWLWMPWRLGAVERGVSGIGDERARRHIESARRRVR